MITAKLFERFVCRKRQCTNLGEFGSEAKSEVTSSGGTSPTVSRFSTRGQESVLRPRV